MGFPKLSMREVRRHPAVITDGDNLKKGMEVATCYLLSPIGRGTRCAQALMSLVPNEDGKARPSAKREALRAGYAHTPTCGIVMQDVAKVNWVNTTNQMQQYPYASLQVSRSTIDLEYSERLAFRATSVSALGELAKAMPSVDADDYYTDERQYSFEKIASFDQLGLADDPYKLQQFIVDISKL